MANWKYYLQLKDLIDDYQDKRKTLSQVSVEAKARIITFQEEHFNDDEDLFYIASDLGDAYDENDFDDIMNELYDFASDKRIWIS